MLLGWFLHFSSLNSLEWLVSYNLWGKNFKRVWITPLLYISGATCTLLMPKLYGDRIVLAMTVDYVHVEYVPGWVCLRLSMPQVEYAPGWVWSMVDYMLHGAVGYYAWWTIRSNIVKIIGQSFSQATFHRSTGHRSQVRHGQTLLQVSTFPLLQTIIQTHYVTIWDI